MRYDALSSSYALKGSVNSTNLRFPFKVLDVAGFYPNLEFLNKFSYKSAIPNFTKIRSSGSRGVTCGHIRLI